MKTVLEKQYLPELVSGEYSDWYYSDGEHYRLLAYLCSGKKQVLDIGTHYGFSALAMSTAKLVYSYDIDPSYMEGRHDMFPENIIFKVGDVLQINDQIIINSEVILLDTFHGGGYEKIFLDHLEKIKYKGVLVMDDIHFSGTMLALWDSVVRKKEDVTEIAHHSGTGIVYYE